MCLRYLFKSSTHSSLLLALVFAGCGDDTPIVADGGLDVPGTDNGTPDTTGTDTTGTDAGVSTDFTLNFRAMVGDEAFGCGITYEGLGSGEVAADGADLRFFVSNIRLVDTGGAEVPFTITPDGRWQHTMVALLDFEDGSGPCMMGNADMNNIVVGTAPSGTYTGIRFDVGVPFDLNHGMLEAAPPPLNVSGMYWVWQGGHKFLRADLVNVEGGMAYNLHLGSTMCASGGAMEPPTEACGRRNVAEVSLDGFNPTVNTIVANLAVVLEDADLTANTPDSPPGCQSFPTDMADCGPIFPKLGLDYGTGMPSGVQSLFAVE